MKRSQILRNYLASEGIEKTPDEAKKIYRSIMKVADISYETYEIVRNMSDEDLITGAKERDISTEKYRELCDLLLYAGKKKFGF